MNILFTGVGGPTPLGLARSIKNIMPYSRCIGVDASPWAAGLYGSELFDATYQVVLGSHPDYWKVMEEIIEKERIDFAFVVPETEKLVWSKRQCQRGLPCPALIQPYALARFCFDKLRVANALYKYGLTPQTYLYRANEIVPMRYPYWIRVKSGAGALGALKINHREELKTWLSLHNHREDFIVSEFLPGRNYACKMLYYQGKLLQHASAERIDYLMAAAAPSGISGMCGRGRLLNRPDLVQRSKTALTAVSERVGEALHGMFTVDFKENDKGEPMITEINIRNVSFNYAFALGGINFAKTMLDAALGNASPGDCVNYFAEENYFIRGVDAPLRLVPVASGVLTQNMS